MADNQLYDFIDADRLKKPGYSGYIPQPDELNPPPGLAPKIGITEDQPSLSDFGASKPVMPRSILGTDVAPGEQISDKQMPKAEKLASDPKAEAKFSAGQDFHNQLRQFGDQKSALDHIMPTNIKDPNYLQDLNSYRAARGAVQENEAKFKMEHPWGTPGNHPGFWGKLGHTLAAVGNAAGEAIAPNVAAAIPGSHLNLEEQAAQGAGGIKEAEGQQAGIQKAKAALDTSAAHQQEADTHATTEPIKANAAATNAESQDRATTVKENALQAQLGEAVRAGDEEQAQKLLDMIKQEKAAKGANLQHVAGTVNGKPTFANFDPVAGHYTDPNTQQVIPNFQPQPPQPPVGGLLVDPNNRVFQAKPGETLKPGTQNLGGFSTMNRPTSQMRNVDAQAQVASEGIPPTIEEIQKLAPQLGPVAGRWNDFMQGKVGMDNADFAGLRADLLMVSSAVALAHARGRLPENLREEFDHMINAPQQTPENLVTVLNHIKPWMDRMGQMGQIPGGGATSPASGTTPPANSGDPLGILK